MMKRFEDDSKNEATLKGVAFAVLVTLFAKGFGFVRELISASVFGTSSYGDAFIVALSIPDILVSGFSSAITALYVPIYFKIQSKNKEEEIKTFNSSVILLIFLIALILLSIVELFPRQVVKLFASGFSASTMDLTVRFLRIMALSIIPIFLSAFFKAYGQIANKFAVMTLYSCIINVMIIFSLIVYGSKKADYLSYSVLFGNVLYAVISYFSARRSKLLFSAHFSLKNRYLKEMIISVIPVFISNIVAEMNQIIDKNFASQLLEGTISALNYSSKIINLITAILGTAIASVLFSGLSKTFAEGDNKKLAHEVEQINGCIIALLIPIMLLLMFFSNTIITFLFGRGNFGEESIRITSECLVFYAVGVIGFNLKAIWIRVYNASLDTKTPAVNSAIAIIINIVLNFMLINILQHKGLALATGLSSLITGLLLIINYKKTNEYFKFESILIEFAKIIVSSFVFIPMMYLTQQLLCSNVCFNILTIVACFIISLVPYVILLILTKSKAGNLIRKMIKIERMKR